FRAFVGQTNFQAVNWRNQGFDQTDEHPVVCVSWNDAQAFCEWLSSKEKGRLYRLPTEAEWEYACRGGLSSSIPFHFGAKDPEPAPSHTSPVGRSPPTPFGLYDMHGNVGEWCADWSDEPYSHHSLRKAPPGPTPAPSRVLRGGSWMVGDRLC